uniref:Ubiquitin-like protease family profile domain-containing protein n=1 Tax=Setaria italica TaxID=4555 RepID=K3YXY0_SETIT
MTGHWIAFMIQPKNGVVTVFDSLDYDQSTYKEFILILQKAYQHYITNGGIHNSKRPKEMVVRTNFPCHKQPSSSVHCGYYMCENIRMIRRYTTDPER